MIQTVLIHLFALAAGVLLGTLAAGPVAVVVVAKKGRAWRGRR